MEIKPLYDKTIKMSVTNLKLEDVKIRARDETIPNGIYRVIKWEKTRQLFTISLNIALIITAAILVILYQLNFNVTWIAYTVPTAIFLLSGWKLFSTIFERKALKRDVIRYKEDLKIGLESTPQFIARMYMKLHEKQVAHNWFTIATLFYGGTTTLLLWWLKDVSWWIFDFKQWISNMFDNPTTMAWLFTILLLGVSILHIIFAVQRKKRILEIDSYFGGALAPQSEIESIKQARNKTYRRIFLISIMIILIIPMVVKFVTKMLRGK